MRTTVACCVLVLLLMASARDATAQGFQVNEHGTCVMGRGGAGVAAPCEDGSGMFYNPAGILSRLGWTVSGGVTFIDARGGFTDDLTGSTVDLANSVVPVPHFFGTYVREKLAFGLGVYVPYGLGTEWPSTFAGRFAGYDNDLTNFYVQPTIAFRPHPRVAVGAGVDVVVGRVTLTQRLDFSEQAVFPGVTAGQLGIAQGTDFANAHLGGNGTGVGAHFGVILGLHPRITFGAKYLTRVSVRYEGSVDFEPVPTGIRLPFANPLGVPAGTPLDSVVASSFTAGPLVDQDATAQATMPDQLTIGIAVRLLNRLTVFTDYNWVNWSLFDTLAVDFDTPTLNTRTIQNYRDSHGARIGLDWEASTKATLRAGYIFHTAAAPPEVVTPLLPEGKRHELTVGLGYAISPYLRADVAYQYLIQQDRRGRVREFPSGTEPTLALNSGLYEFFAHLLGVTFTVGF